MRYALDTNVWIYASTHAAFAQELGKLTLKRVGLVAVVAHELVRRATSQEAVALARGVVARWQHATLDPTFTDWVVAAECLRKLRHHHHYDAVGLQRLQNDALIAVACRRVGWTVVTCNRVDFERLRAVLERKAPPVLFLDAPAPESKGQMPPLDECCSGELLHRRDVLLFP